MVISTKKNFLTLESAIFGCLAGFTAFSMFSISLTQIFAGLGGILWLAKTHLSRTWKDLYLPLGIPFLIFAVACVLAVGFGEDPLHSFPPLKLLLLIPIFFWVINSIQTFRQLEFLVWVLTFSVSLATLYGFYQAWESGVTTLTRVEGTLSVYMTFAGLLMMTGLLLLARLLFNNKKELFLIVPVAMIFICLIFTLTRQAWFGFITGLVFLVFIRKKIFLLIIPFLLMGVFFVSGGHTKDRFKSLIDLNDKNLIIRLHLWRAGWLIFKDHPITGCGFKCVDLINSRYPDPNGYVKRYKGLHNNFVQLAVDTGIIGLGAWLFIWIRFFTGIYRKGEVSPANDPLKWIRLGSAAAVLGFLAGGLFEVNFYDAEVAMLLYFIMALPFVKAGALIDGPPAKTIPT